MQARGALRDRFVAFAVALAVSVPASGCSLVLVPKPSPQRPESCKPRSSAPYADVAFSGGTLVWSIVTLLLAVGIKTCSEDGTCHEHEGRPAAYPWAIGLGAMAVTYGTSATVGFLRVRECRRVRAQQQSAPPPLDGPPGMMPAGGLR